MDGVSPGGKDWASVYSKQFPAQQRFPRSFNDDSERAKLSKAALSEQQLAQLEETSLKKLQQKNYEILRKIDETKYQMESSGTPEQKQARDTATSGSNVAALM